jgi:hypothetical protein
MKLHDLMRYGFYRDIDDAGGGGAALENTPVEAPEGAAPVEAAAPSNVSSDAPRYVTQETLDQFAGTLLGQVRELLQPAHAETEAVAQPDVPDMYEDPGAYAAYVAEQAVQRAIAPLQNEIANLRGDFSQTINPLREREALQSVGGQEAAAFLADVPQEYRAQLLQIPSVAQAFREATAARIAAKPKPVAAPRSENGYQGDQLALDNRAQGEIRRAVDGFREAFPDLTESQLTKLVLSRSGGQN